METKTKRSSSAKFKANRVPNFAKAYDSFMNEMEKKKQISKPTEPKPFSFHEPKKKAALRDYLDNENDPKAKNPNFKRNIEEIILKIQQKPKLEPASTKSLDLLMATRRKELEDKQKKEQQVKDEDAKRAESQNRLKERVTKSKHLVNNSKALEESKKKKQETFKQQLISDKKTYEEELERRKQRVNNKPLMFEQSYNNVTKFKANKLVMEAIQEELNKDKEKEI